MRRRSGSRSTSAECDAVRAPPSEAAAIASASDLCAHCATGSARRRQSADRIIAKAHRLDAATVSDRPIDNNDIRIRIVDSGNHFGTHAAGIGRVLRAAVIHVNGLSTLSNVDIIVHPVDYGDHQFAVSGLTMGGNNIHIEIECSQLADEDFDLDLFRTAVHELHHALRWRSVRDGWTVGEIVVLEGLAIMADHVAAGPQDGVDRPLTDPDAALAELLLFEAAPQFSHRLWLYSSEADQPGGIGRAYSLGLLLMRATLERTGLDPWQAAAWSTVGLLKAGRAELKRTGAT